jgi:SAM-dependent methyltransferase
MISRAMKETFYRSMSLPMRMNGWIYRNFRAPSNGTLKVHLGPGQEKYLAGWVNVDANFLTARIDVWADIRYRLPFRDNTVDAIYSHHVIEHLADHRLTFHFREMFRILKPGGVVRVGGPDGETAARKFVEGDVSWFGNFPDPHDSLGGKFTNFIICRGEHLTILSHSYLTEVAHAVGFKNVVRCQPITETHQGEIFAEAMKTEWETTPDAPHTLLIEAQKPKA